MLRRALTWLVPESNPSRTVFGLITVGALLAAESGIHDTYAETIGSVTIALFVYWFAHAYSDLLGTRLASRARLDWGLVLGSFAHEWAIIKGAALPLVALVVAGAAGAPQETAVAAAVWTSVFGLIAFELAAGVLAGARRRELIVDGVVGAIMGVGILALRAVVH